MKCLVIFICVLAFIAQSNEPPKDDIACIRIQDSSFGHFLSCKTQKPMPLNVQATFAVDKTFTWSPDGYSVVLFNTQTKGSWGLNCIQGRPGPGTKNVGQNLTLSTMCDRLPRQLKQYDVIRYGVHFPNLDWLIWAVPIPGYSTSQDAQIAMKQHIEVTQFETIKTQTESPASKTQNKGQKSLLSKILLKNLRKSQQ